MQDQETETANTSMGKTWMFIPAAFVILIAIGVALS